MSIMRLSAGFPKQILATRTPSTQWLSIEVVDSGTGIGPADHQRVFEEFEQIDLGPRTDTLNPGTGLGLAISRRLARLLSGELLLESELGKGSTFTLVAARGRKADQGRRRIPRIFAKIPVSSGAGTSGAATSVLAEAS